MEVFVRPILLKLAGNLRYDRLTVPAELAEPVESDGRETYLRVTLEPQGAYYLARTAGHQGSNIVTSLVRADGLLIIPEGVTALPAGARLLAWLLDTG